MLISDAVYLDHAGTTPYPKSLMDRFAAEMTASLFGNPHSASQSSQLSTSRIEDVRLRVLQFFGADPTAFDVVFVANATTGIKMVLEALRALPGGFDYVYHQACHTSLVGVREDAVRAVCVNNAHVSRLIDRSSAPFEDDGSTRTMLFAYPAQSNMDGSRFPLSWTHEMRDAGDGRQGARVYTLLDAAALVATSPLDLSNSALAPDFIVISFYKCFGFPDLGGLIVRKEAEPIFDRRKYFGGGTVDTVVCIGEQWHAPKSDSLHDRLEDGTLPVHSIVALDIAMRTHSELYGSMTRVARHAAYLASRLRNGLASLKHGNGKPVCVLYPNDEPRDPPHRDRGPVVAFNLKNPFGAWVSPTEFEKLATLKKFHVRTGGICNPGGIAAALDLQPWEMRRNFSAGFRCGNEVDIIGGKPAGVIRLSLGAMSIKSDVDKFISFVKEFYQVDEGVHEQPRRLGNTMASRSHSLYVHSLVIYPIKSCGGYVIPKDTRWEVKPEGLAWDREWCLVHRGSGRALSLKQYPKMALLRPSIDFSMGVLRVTYAAKLSGGGVGEVSVPLSANPSLFDSSASRLPRKSRVCGEEIYAQAYVSDEINDFFSAALGVPCALARFPPGGDGVKSIRYNKAHLQKHQTTSSRASYAIPGAFPSPPSSPDSETEQVKCRRILLSNESPILAINLSSLDELNRQILERGGEAVSGAVFRANVVIGSSTPQPPKFAYSEDYWRSLRIGQHEFHMLGSCRRCHMVCVDPETGSKREEPFVTLAKTRRFDGKVFFGTHMCHNPSRPSTPEEQLPTIKVGDSVVVCS